MVRTPAVRPVDNLKPEGNIDFSKKQPFKPAEKVTPTKPQDNLYVSGVFEGILIITSNTFLYRNKRNSFECCLIVIL